MLYFINIVIALAQLGYPIIFFIVYGTVADALISKAIGSGTFFSTKWFTHSLLAVLMLYLILKKELASLKYANIFLFFVVSFFVFFLLVHLLASGTAPEQHIVLDESHVNVTFISVFPTLFSSYGFNPAFFGAYASLKIKSHKNVMSSGLMAIII